MPAGEARILPVSASAISEQSGWWPDRRDRLASSLERSRRRLSVGAWGETVVDAELGPRWRRAIASAVWRARRRGLVTTTTGGVGCARQRIAKSTRLSLARLRERPQLVGVARAGLRVANEEEEHRRRA